MALKAAVVGVGYLGRFHAQKYKLVSDVELVGVYDASPERAVLVAAELNVPVLKTLDEVAERAQLVSIASTTQTHYEVAKKLLEKNVNCLLEKPMTVEGKQARELVAIAKKNKLVLQVGHIERFNPAWKEAEKHFRNPHFIQCVRVGPYKSRGNDASVVLDLMVHDIDLVLSIIKSPVKSILATGQKIITNELDYASARLVFESGQCADLTASRVSPDTERRVRIFQDDVVVVDLAQMLVNQFTSKIEHFEVQRYDALQAQVQDFVDCVVRGKTPIVGGEDGAFAVELSQQIIAAIAGSSRST